MTIHERKAALLAQGAVQCEACGHVNVREFGDVDAEQEIVALGASGECGHCGQPVEA